MEPFLYKHEDKLYRVETSDDVLKSCSSCALSDVCNLRLKTDCEVYLCMDQYFVEYENKQIQINSTVNGTGVSSVQRQRRR